MPTHAYRIAAIEPFHPMRILAETGDKQENIPLWT